MTWFLFALVGPFCWMIANFVDKYTVEHFIPEEHDPGMLVLFTSLTGILFLPIVFLFTRDIFSIPLTSILGLIATGIILVLGFIFYCRALQYDDASNVIPFFQLNPIFLYIFGTLFLHEYITLGKTLAGFCVLIGVFFFSYNYQQKKFKKKVVINMLLAALLTSSTTFLYKFFTLGQATYFDALAWELLGYGICGIVIFVLVKSYREQFLAFFRQDNKQVLVLGTGSEVLSTLGNITAQYATLLAPVFFVSLVNSFQPIMTFFTGYLITKSSLKLSENITKEVLYYKYIGFAILTLGVILFVVQ